MTIQFDGNTGIFTTGNVTANNFIGNFSGNVSVPGVNTEVIFNDDGIANGSLAFVFDKTSNTVTVDGEIISTDANVTGTLVANSLIAGPTTVNGDATVNGNLTVSGNVSFIDINRVETEDPMIVLGIGPNGSPLTTNDGRDRGVHMDYYSNVANAQQSAFVGWINSTGNMVAASNVSITDDVVTVNELGTFEAGNIFAATGNYSGNVTALNLYTTHFTNSTTVYVDGSRQDTYLENGTYGQPFKTIQAAIDNIALQTLAVRQQNWSIVIASGIYAENIDLNNKGIYYLSFLGLGRTVINPASGNSLTSNADNDELAILDFNNIEFRTPVVIAGSGLENQLIECLWRNCEFRGLELSAIASVYTSNISWKNTIEFTNLGFLYVDGSLTLPPGNAVVTVDDSLPAPFGTSGNFVIQAFNLLIGDISFQISGAYSLIFETNNCRVGSFGDSYTIPAGMNWIANQTIVRGTWTNNGALNLRNSMTETPVLGTSPIFYGNFGGANLSVSGTSNIGNTNVTGNIVPTADNTYSLGTANLQWKDLFVSGNTIFMSNVPLTVDGNTLQINGANVLTEVGPGGNTVIPGNVTINNNLSVEGNTTLVDLEVTGNITIDQDLIVNGNIILNELEISGNVIIDSNLTVNSNVQFNSDLNVVGNLSVDGNVEFNSELNVTGNVVIDSNLTVNSNVQFNSDLDVTGNIDVTGNVTIDSNLSVNGTAILSELEVTGNANIVGNTTTGGILTDNYYYANGQPVDFEQPAGSNTEVQYNSDGDFGASANFTFNEATNVLTVAGNISGANLVTAGVVTATGNVTGGNLRTTGTANVGALAVTGNAAVSGNIGVTGNVVGGNVNTVGTANIGTLAVTGNAGVTGNLVAGNIGTIGTANVGTLEVTGTANVVGNIDAGNVNTAGTANIGTLEITGDANVVGNTTTGGILTDNYYYANGQPVDFEQPAGSNTQVQYNSDGDFGASANFTFNEATNALTVAGNISGANIVTAGVVDATGNITGGNLTTTGTANVGTLAVTGNASVVGNAVIGNVRTQYIYGTPAGSNLVITATGVDSSITVVPTGAGSLDVSNKRITSLATPVTDSDAATKLYVDEVAQGLKVKDSVYAATTAALPSYVYNNGTAGVGATITANNPGALTLDGTTPGVGERVLVKNEIGANEPYNGVYVVTVAGDGSTAFVLTRTSDFDNSPTGEVAGAFVFIQQGATLADTGWVCITDEPVTIGTTPLQFVQFSGAGTYLAGSGLTLTGEVFSVNVDNDTIEITPQGNVIVKPGANLVTPNIGNAVGNSLTLTGNLTAENLNVANVEIGNLIVDEVDANTANISGNAAFGGVLTDNYYYANGQPVDFEQPAGSNTQVQYNSDGDFGASANFTFNESTNVLTVTGNIQSNVLGVTGNITSGNISTGTLTSNTAINANTLVVSSTMSANGNAQFSSNVAITNDLTVGGNIVVDGNINLIGNINEITGNTGVFYGANTTGFDALYAGIESGFAVLDQTVVQGSGNFNGFIQINFQNINSGEKASTDFVCTADNGNNEAYYINMGITSSTYDGSEPSGLGNTVFPNDGYLYTQDGNMVLGTPSIGKVTKIVTGGQGTDFQTATFNPGGTESTSTSTGALVVLGGTGVEGNLYSANVYTTGAFATTANISGNVTAGNVAGGNLVSANFFSGTLTTAAQPNITSVGTLTTLTVTGNISGGNISTGGVITATGNITGGNLSGTNITGTLTTAAQTNITSVGTLISLDVTGNISGGNVAGGNLVSANFLTGTLTTAAQPNITSVGTLTGLGVTGNVTAGNINGGNLVTANFFTGTLTTAEQPNITSVGTLTSLAVTGNVTANNFIGNVIGNISGNITVPGSNTNVLFNDDGLANATAGFTFNKTNNSVAVTGNLSAGNISGGNLVTANFFAGTLTTAAQPNITSVGNLTSLSVTGNVDGGNLNTAGRVVASRLESNVATGTAPLTVASTTLVTNLNADLLDGYNSSITAVANTVVVRDANANVSANVFTGNSFDISGNAVIAGNLNVGGNITYTNITDLNISDPIVGLGRGPNNTPLTSNDGKDRGAELWYYTTSEKSAFFGYDNSIGKLIAATDVTNNADVITVNDYGNLVIGGLEADTGAFSGNVSTGNVSGTTGAFTNVSGNGSALTGLNASNISSGTLDQARLANSSLTVNGTSITLGGSGTVTANAATLTGTTLNSTVVSSSLTSVGTLGSLTVTGNISGGNISTGGVITATGNITGGNVSGTNITGTLTTAAQPNVTSVGTLTSLDVTGNISGGNISTVGTAVLGTVETVTLTTGANTTAGTITGNWTLTTGSRLEATYADLAERYTSDEQYEPGTILMIGGTAEVTIADKSGQYRLAGIVSTAPAYVLNSTIPDSVIVALTGRVPCRVVGKIQKGDLITISDIPGVGTSVAPPASGTVVGRALQDYDSDQVGVIEVKVDQC